jgi:hypothetical protein
MSNFICPGCSNPKQKHYAKGWCYNCYQMAWRGKVPHPRDRKATCHPDRQHLAKGFCKPCYKKDYDVTHNSNRRIYILNAYGLTLEQHDALLKQQKGHCRFCDATSAGRKRLHIDHDHLTGRVRGLVCAKHHIMITIIENHRDILKDVMAYLAPKLTES